jgi:riboflavin synthase
VFTGLVDDVGEVVAVAATPAGRELRIRSRYEDLREGESIAVNGACLTMRHAGAGSFSVAAVETTLARTTIGSWAPGHRVNLERALRAGDRLGGHLVQGHVDGVGRVRHVEREGDARLVEIALPADLAVVMVAQGSVTVDGVSLTVNAIPGPGTFRVAIIEYTERHTTLGRLAVGDRVHVEGDLIGKYVQVLAAAWRPGTAGGAESRWPA